MTLDEYEKLEKSATPEPVTIQNRGEYNRVIISGEDVVSKHLSLEDAKIFAASRNIAPEVTALVRAVRLFQFEVSDFAYAGMFRALEALEIKLEEQ